METIRTAAGTMVRMAESGVVFCVVGCVVLVGFVAVAIPADGLGGTNLVKRKKPLGESGTEQNKSTGPRTFRTDSDVAIWKRRKRLPEITTVRAEESDINARDERSLRAGVGYYWVRRRVRLRFVHGKFGTALGRAC
jgi:hypothetical protein